MNISGYHLLAYLIQHKSVLLRAWQVWRWHWRYLKLIRDGDNYLVQHNFHSKEKRRGG